MFERSQGGGQRPLRSGSPGWPRWMPPPGSEGWEADAVVFLLDHCPADFRRYSVLQRHPLVLAHFARRFVAAESEAASLGTAETRVHLAGLVPEPAIAASLDAWQAEAARLARARRAVELVEQALREQCHTPR